MTDHESMKDRVFALHDGELPPADRAETERHLAACAECRSELDAWKRAAPALFPSLREEPPASFADRVMERLEPSWPRKSLLDRLRAALTPARTAFAGAAALALGAIFLPLESPVRADPDAGVRYAADVWEAAVLETEEEASSASAVQEYFL